MTEQEQLTTALALTALHVEGRYDDEQVLLDTITPADRAQVFMALVSLAGIFATRLVESNGGDSSMVPGWLRTVALIGPLTDDEAEA